MLEGLRDRQKLDTNSNEQQDVANRLIALYQETGQPAKAQTVINEYSDRLYGFSFLPSRSIPITLSFFVSSLPYCTCDRPEENNLFPLDYARIRRRGHNLYSCPSTISPPIRSLPRTSPSFQKSSSYSDRSPQPQFAATPGVK